MTPLARSPYTGESRRLVIAFDIGTTHSGVSYSILTPGEIPEIFPVKRFPHQGVVGDNCKIPTVIYYDKQGKVCATGIDDLEDFEPDEVENWTKVQWFKMHLRPKSSAASDAADQITPLPPNKTIIDIFADFMEYLYHCTRLYFQQIFSNQPDFLVSMDRKNAIDFILTHPNGWEGSQQAQMRQAAVRAKLVPDTGAGQARVCFVTEGEASLHLCIERGLMTPEMERGEGVLIVDAGGGTIDISAYSRNLAAKEKNTFEEIAAAQCKLINLLNLRRFEMLTICAFVTPIDSLILSNKAVADGGVSYFIDHLVTTRVSKYACGIRCHLRYDSNDEEHRQRSSQVFHDVDGSQHLRNSFSIILPKDTEVSETKEFRRSYYRKSINRSDFGNLADRILCYKGGSPHPRWTDVDAGSYSTLCNVVDNGQLINTSRYVSHGDYYIVEYDVVLAFGLTELAAQYAWKENVSQCYISPETGPDRCLSLIRVLRNGLSFSFLIACIVHNGSARCPAEITYDV
ncbi:hypothetical protein PISMIDRAFT_641667 [Pisolithus microcarpus 441]|uniref:Uncharacterized protein n=1 Tax=Pisolithus microcarpus 441 TaxID=765257 RepID=A0A0C9Z4W6_9AGAM|nr:hypothetical protein PISMIDRAFT_641667 [Pisolithus microcarpus 441]